MAVSATATRLGVNQATLSAQFMSADTAAAEVLTVNHDLGFTPDKVTAQLRSVTAAASSAPVIAVNSWNASVALVQLNAGLGVRSLSLDVHLVREHTVVR